MGNIKPKNPNQCFCQSQYCIYKKDNICKLTGKEIIGTALCDDCEYDQGGGENEKMYI